MCLSLIFEWWNSQSCFVFCAFYHSKIEKWTHFPQKVYKLKKLRKLSFWQNERRQKPKTLVSAHVNRVLGQKFKRTPKSAFECFKLMWSRNLTIANTQPLWLWSRIRSRVKITHYIQPSNHSSALAFWASSFKAITNWSQCLSKEFIFSQQAFFSVCM